MNRIFTISCLVYWFLLVNLGPSVHTLSVFGLHQHGSCGTVCCDQSNGNGDHRHRHRLSQSRSVDHHCCGAHDDDSLENHGFEIAASDLLLDHDCHLCDFFDYLSATDTDSLQWLVQSTVTSISHRTPGLASAVDVWAQARGPPVSV